MSSYKQEGIFDSFTRQYALSKTLRFELRPDEATKQLLKEEKVFEKDKLVDDNYHKIKYYFDILHRDFIDESLKNISISDTEYQEYEELLRKLRKNDKENKKALEIEIEKKSDIFRKKVVSGFEVTAKDWKSRFIKNGIGLKKSGCEILFEEANLRVLKILFTEKPSNEAPEILLDGGINLFDAFKGFHTYFTTFNATRRNLYSSEEKATAVANRAINENLRVFVNNCIQYKNFKEYEKIGFTEQEQSIFATRFYNTCFSQAGIDVLNDILGGTVGKNGEKIQGVNEKINLYNQKNKTKLPQFKKLYKQILSHKETRRRNVEIKSDAEVFMVVRESMVLSDEKFLFAKNIFDVFLSSGVQDDTSRLQQIYVKGAALNTISGKWFRSWASIQALLVSKKKKGEVPTEIIDFISFWSLKKAFLACGSQADDEDRISARDLFREEYTTLFHGDDHYETFLSIWKSEFEKCLKDYESTKGTLLKQMERDGDYQKEASQIASIKEYADASLAVFRMMKYFALEKGRKKIEPKEGSDAAFYNLFNEYDEDYRFQEYYNEFRNYLTRKAHLGRLLFPTFGDQFEERHAFSKRKIGGAEKIKLNFENGTLLGGWDLNKESDNFGIILRKKSGEYFLALLRNEGKQIFDKQKNPELFEGENSEWEKMEYKYLPGPNKMLPKVCFAKNNVYTKENPLGKFIVPQEIWDIRKKESFKKGDAFSKLDLIRWIDFFKDCIGKYPNWNSFAFQFKSSDAYADVSGFYNDVARYGYGVSFVGISERILQRLIAEKKMYLFQIYSRDFSLEGKGGKENLQSMYFKALFEKANLQNPVLKLSGEAEIFFRPGNNKLKKKTLESGKEVVEHKRYQENKMFLHLPLVLNYCAKEGKLNTKINQTIALNKHNQLSAPNIIGIDRGEKHLAYYCVIDQNGNILKEKDALESLNNPLGLKDYAEMLEAKAGSRDEARKNWETVETIKELKDGYISQVVRRLCDLVLCYNAVIVFEDLNSGFKRGRQKIEKQVYQKLELALVKKLNYLVNKGASVGDSGHCLNAYQLTPLVKTFGDIGRQCGIVFYTAAGYTSLTCPQCGYRKNLSFRFESVPKAHEQIKNAKLDIRFESQRKGICCKLFSP
jgi:hypothetical protein